MNTKTKGKLRLKKGIFKIRVGKFYDSHLATLPRGAVQLGLRRRRSRLTRNSWQEVARTHRRAIGISS
jgi:hypothetical protein